MFNRLHVSPVVRVQETKIVHEHRAPTDESIQILREMERKAQEQVEKAVRVENCPIDAVIHKCRDFMTSDTLYKVIFRINGKQIRVDHREKMGDSKEQTAVAIRDAVATEIASELTEKFASSIFNVGAV